MRSAATAVLTLALSLSGSPAWAGERHAAPRYVSLGDSYSSGVGSGGNESGGTCHRTTNAYPARWAKAHQSYDSVLNACSGASVGEVRTGQLAALNDNTTLVTVTAGGNDIGFARTMAVCFIDIRGHDCTSLAGSGADLARKSLPERLRRLYAAIHTRAPHARVLVLGYPHFYREGKASCLGFSDRERTAINNTIDVLDGVLEREATTAGFHYVEVRRPFTGHEACTPHPWMNGPTFPPLNSFHPNAAGQRDGYLAAMTAVTG